MRSRRFVVAASRPEVDVLLAAGLYGTHSSGTLRAECVSVSHECGEWAVSMRCRDRELIAENKNREIGKKKKKHTNTCQSQLAVLFVQSSHRTNSQ